MMIRLIILFLFAVCSIATAGDLTPFKSDGCSVFPDGTISQKDLWLECCIEHDMSYWAGGSRSQRQQADEQLKVCVTQVGEAGIAQLMLAGVRVGGTPYLPTSFRWGYGWPFLRGYKSLTPKEQALVDLELKKFQTRADNTNVQSLGECR